MEEMLKAVFWPNVAQWKKAFLSSAGFELLTFFASPRFLRGEAHKAETNRADGSRTIDHVDIGKEGLIVIHISENSTANSW